MKLLSSYVVRRCFIADRGYAILSADFDQIELRIAAALAGETVLIEAAKRGESLHKIAAVELFGPDYTPDQYRYTKNVNFGWLFGGGPVTLAEQAGIPINMAKAIIDKYGKSFAALTAYKRKLQESVIKSALTSGAYAALRNCQRRRWQYRSDTPQGRQAQTVLSAEIDRMLRGKTGYVTTRYGRRLIVDARKAYTATNYIVQSTARDVLAEAMLRVMDDPELSNYVLLPIHDELLGQAPIADAEYIAQRFGEVMSTELEGVPLTATGKVYGKSWGHGYR